MIGTIIKSILKLSIAYIAVISLVKYFIGENGLFETAFNEWPVLTIIIYSVLITHITITSMSLSFHRYHTHKGVIINTFLDTLMQINLWLVGGMSKLDWVSVHIYHHAHSDKEKDPHSPVQKGLFHVLFLGVFDYSLAKSSAPVLKIRKTLKRNKVEQFLADYTLSGPVLLTLINIILFGPFYGSILSVINFSVSPIFAVGGVNGLAHWIGYKNHNYHDNSRNLGFFLPLNFLICGELDHNNHHAHPKSCSFRHKWYEFDWGYSYIKILNFFGLATIKNAYTVKSLKLDMRVHLEQLMNKDLRFKQKAQELATDLNKSYSEFQAEIGDYIEGKKVKLQKEARLYVSELQRTFYANYRLGLKYN